MTMLSAIGGVLSLASLSYIDIFSDYNVFLSICTFIEVDFIQLSPLALVGQMMTVQILVYINCLADALVKRIRAFLDQARMEKLDFRTKEHFMDWSINVSNRIIDTFKLADKTFGALIFLEVQLTVVNNLVTSP